MNIQKIAVQAINPVPYNPRIDLKPGDPEYQKLKRSITEFGYIEPLVWNRRTGNLVGGHQRFKVLLEQGIKEIECSVVDLDEPKEKALNIALNKISGQWDISLLGNVLQDLYKESTTLELTGFDTTEVDLIIAQSQHEQIINIDDFFKDGEEEKTKKDTFHCPHCGKEIL